MIPDKTGDEDIKFDSESAGEISEEPFVFDDRIKKEK